MGKPKGKITLWDSIECEAWSRGFDHEAYLHLVKAWEYDHHPLDYSGYTELCNLLDNHLERNIDNG